MVTTFGDNLSCFLRVDMLKSTRFPILTTFLSVIEFTDCLRLSPVMSSDFTVM